MSGCTRMLSYKTSRLMNFDELKMDNLLTFILVAVILIISNERLLVSGSSRSISASVGEDVTLNCSVDSHITPEHTEEVSWKKTDEDEDILVLLYQNNQTLSDSSHERYRDRVEFFTAEIPKGNFSLRLKRVRTEDKGVYICQVFAGGLSANATAVLERLGFSVSHIVVLIFCICASGSVLLLCCLIYCRSHDKGFLVQRCCNQIFLGSSVVLPCYVDKLSLMEGLEVEWRRTDSKALVHLYKNGAEARQKDYHDRAHFFTDQIQHGNFSLRLDNLTAEDEGRYTCRVYNKKDCVYSSETNLMQTFTVEESDSLVVPLGSSVVFPCQINKRLLKKRLKVEWRRTDSEALDHLYKNGAESQQQDYHDRAHFFTDKIQHGNFSLRLDNLTAEDEGRYTCRVYSEKDCVYSAITDLELWFEIKHSCRTLVPLGSSVVLPCYVDKLSQMEGLKVEWRRTDSEALVHLYKNGAEAQQKDYHGRAHFFTDQIQHGNFSLRLDKLTAEDEGQYTCTVYRNQTFVFSSETNLELRLQESLLRLHLFLVFCPNTIMYFAFVFWGVSEGSLNESVSCCALYFLRPIVLLWAAPYVQQLPENSKKRILQYGYFAEYVPFSIVVYSALFTSTWQNVLNYPVFDRVVIIVLFSVMILTCLCKIIYVLVIEIGKKSGWIIEIFDTVADMAFDIVPTLQFILLFYTFASVKRAFIIVVILPVLLMMTNDRWTFRCGKLNCSPLVIRAVMLIFIFLVNVAMIGLYFMTVEKKTDPIGWGFVMMFMQLIWAVMKFTDKKFNYLHFNQDFHRVVPVYLFGSVAFVLLTSTALFAEMILTANVDRTVGDLRFIVFPSESFFVFCVLMSGHISSKPTESCQNAERCNRVHTSQQNQNTAEMTEDQDETQPDSGVSQTRGPDFPSNI